MIHSYGETRAPARSADDYRIPPYSFHASRAHPCSARYGDKPIEQELSADEANITKGHSPDGAESLCDIPRRHSYSIRSERAARTRAQHGAATSPRYRTQTVDRAKFTLRDVPRRQ